MRKIGLAIDHLRKYTIEEMAVDIGVPPTYMNEVCHGLREPGPAFVAKAAELLGVTVDDLERRA